MSSLHSTTKNVSRRTRGAIIKNSARVEAAIADKLESCTYGCITKKYGNSFCVIDTDRKEHIGFIRGKLPRMDIGSVVLLNIRDYESRSASDKAVYDIMAVFNNKNTHQLLKNGIIPAWMAGKDDVEEDIFDYDEEPTQKHKSTKKNHSVNNKHDSYDTDSDVDINAI